MARIHIPHTTIARMAATAALMLFCLLAATAQTTDSLSICPTPAECTDSAEVPGRSLWTRFIDYFKKGNTTSDKKFDLGVLPGPHYSSTVGFGVGIVATGVYSNDRTDSLLPKSNVAVYADFTTKGQIKGGVKGTNIFPHQRFRLDYALYIYTFPRDFWGIGYDRCDQDSNQTGIRYNRFDAKVRFMARIAKNTYIGPFFNYQRISATDVGQMPLGTDLFEGQRHQTHATTVGASFTYDSRDFILNAYRGCFLQIDQIFTPRFLGNDYCFSSTEFTLSGYQQMWKGAVLAGELHGRFVYGNPAWCFLSEVGSNDRMRGYYEGRYRDRDIIEAQVELRQRIKGRHGIAVWAGGAEVFPYLSHMRWDRILPNYGLGYRWEFKHRINVRIDYGFTRNGGGLVFSLNEAF